MKKAVLILVIIGTVASLILGIIWLSDYNNTKDLVDSAKDL
jgi:DNA-binding transcriptional regulator of glucitol operon